MDYSSSEPNKDERVYLQNTVNEYFEKKVFGLEQIKITGNLFAHNFVNWCMEEAQHDDSITAEDITFAPETIQKLKEIALMFHSTNLKAIYYICAHSDLFPNDSMESLDQIACDLLLSLQGAGAGFWEIDQNASEYLLQEAVEKHPNHLNISLYQGDDGLIYL